MGYFGLWQRPDSYGGCCAKPLRARLGIEENYLYSYHLSRIVFCRSHVLKLNLKKHKVVKGKDSKNAAKVETSEKPLRCSH